MYKSCFLRLSLCLLLGGISILCLPADNIDPLLRQAVDASLQKDFRTSYKLLFRAHQLAQEHNDPTKLFWVLTNLGINQAEQYNYTDALSYFIQAQRIAKQHLGIRQQLSIRNNIAGLYMLDHRRQEALAEYLKIYHAINRSEQDRLFRGGCALNIANLYIEQNDTLHALPFVREASRCLSSSPNDSTAVITMEVNYLLAAGHPQTAHNLAINALRKYPLQPDLNYQLARTLICLNRFHEAQQVIKSQLQATAQAEVRIDLFELLAQSFIKQHDWTSAIACKDSVEATTRKLFSQRSQTQYESLQMQFDMLQQQQEINDLNARHRLNLAILALCLVVLVATIWVLVLQIRARHRQHRLTVLERKEQQEQAERLKQELVHQRHEAHSEQVKAQEAIEQRSRELISKALVTANKNDQLRELLQILSSSEDVKQHLSPILRNRIRQMQKQLDSTEEWRNFTTYFEQVNAAFIQRLHELHPSLSPNEIRYLSLVSINLSTKEISLLLNITPEYCKKKKQQIAHKMGLPETRGLYTYLTHLLESHTQGINTSE